MSFKAATMIRILFLLSGLIVISSGAWGDDTFKLPKVLPREVYGNIMINRTSTKNGMKPVVFSHWQHRTKYTCRVCHAELEFNMKTNTTEIREVANRQGKFCGACHNGKITFKPNGNCDKCHSGDIDYKSENYSYFAKNNFPRTSFGDGINWVEAIKTGVIKPKNFLKTESGDIPFEKNLVIEAGWTGITPVVFSHKIHLQWLECSNCHPDLFNIKKRTTAHFSMDYIINGQFCGACHMTVAFPIHDCNRCHPGIQRK